MSRNADRERLKNKVTRIGGSGSQASIKTAAMRKANTTTTTKKAGPTTVPAYGGSMATKGVGSTIPGTTTPSLSGKLKSAMSDFANGSGGSWMPSSNPSGAVTPSTTATGGGLGSAATSAARKSIVGAALGGVGGSGVPTREAESTPPQVTAVSAPTGGGGGEYSGGVTDLSDYLRQQQQAATEAALAALKSAYDKNALLYSHQRSQLSPLYDAQRNQLASDVARARRAYDERALSSGLNTGTAGQADLARSSVMQQGMADIGKAEADALAEIDLARAQLQAEYENAIAQKKAEDGAALLEQLYKEAVRQDNARMSQAATPSYTTVSTPAASGGSSGETAIDRLKANSGLPNGSTKNSNGLVSFGGYKNTTAYERALSYAKAGAQARRTANLLNGYVKSGQITSKQANQIMSELY